jgi:hypothetical protein
MIEQCLNAMLHIAQALVRKSLMYYSQCHLKIVWSSMYSTMAMATSQGTIDGYE